MTAVLDLAEAMAQGVHQLVDVGESGVGLAGAA
jgi:hypothetical protein